MKSDFFWGFASSLLVALSMNFHRVFIDGTYTRNAGLENTEKITIFGLALVLYVVVFVAMGLALIYFKLLPGFGRGMLASAGVLSLILIISLIAGLS